jgi:hypothetical protein
LKSSRRRGSPLLVASDCASASADVTPPPANGPFDYQLGGAYPPPAGTRIVTRDRTDSPQPGVYSICYVNAFQTQPGELRWWRARHRSLLLRRHGREVHDPGWPGEVLLDTSTARNRAGLASSGGGSMAAPATASRRSSRTTSTAGRARTTGSPAPATSRWRDG